MDFRTTTARAGAVALAALLLSSCGSAVSFPDREPDARGTLAPYDLDPTFSYPPDTVIFRLTVEEDEFSYYTDAVLSIDEDTVVGTQTGKSLDYSDLSEGQWVEVWTDACRESYPVQCDVTHVRLTAVDDLGM
jgi:hypothetical protein